VGILDSGTPAPPLLDFGTDASFCESKCTPNARSARMPLTISRKTPTETRRLKNADRVEQFFFMYFEGHEMADWLSLDTLSRLFFLHALHFCVIRAKNFFVSNAQTEFVKHFFRKNHKNPWGDAPTPVS